MKQAKKTQSSRSTYQKRFLRQKISELTYLEGWDNDPEIVEKVQRLSKALERVGTQEKQLSSDRPICTMEELSVNSYIQLKKQGYLDREIKYIFNITAYALARWKKSLGLTKGVVRDLLEVM